MNAGMDDAERNLPKNHKEMRAALSHLKLLCFSEINDNILMWAALCKKPHRRLIEFAAIEDIDSAWGAAKPVR
jgi:hypothetical protein